MESEDRELVDLVPREARIEMEKELPEYFITDDPVLRNPNSNTVQLEITFKRRLTNDAIKTFLPSLLLIIISYSTSFFRLPSFFNTAITVNLTVMLTVTTLLISVISRLAQTSYVKWIELWLIFAQLVPFSQVILITMIELLREEQNIEKPMEKAKESCWVDIGGKKIKVTNNKI